MHTSCVDLYEDVNELSASPVALMRRTWHPVSVARLTPRQHVHCVHHRIRPSLQIYNKDDPGAAVLHAPRLKLYKDVHKNSASPVVPMRRIRHPVSVTRLTPCQHVYCVHHRTRPSLQIYNKDDPGAAARHTSRFALQEDQHKNSVSPLVPIHRIRHPVSVTRLASRKALGVSYTRGDRCSSAMTAIQTTPLRVLLVVTLKSTYAEIRLPPSH